MSTAIENTTVQNRLLTTVGTTTPAIVGAVIAVTAVIAAVIFLKYTGKIPTL